LAWAQIAATGAAALSMRAVAREMGMTSSGLYRYFASRDELLGTLATDAFASLADCLEAAEANDQTAGSSAFLSIARAYRGWALEHPTEYALMFGGPTPGLDTDYPQTKQEMFRGIAVLFRCMESVVREGRIRPPGLDPVADRRLRATLTKWGAHLPGRLPPEALAACMTCWTQLHGAISLELFEHLPAELLPADDLFNRLMRQLLANIGVLID
jgi:AcrR family transcriptional regulator